MLNDRPLMGDCLQARQIKPLTYLPIVTLETDNKFAQ